MMSLTLRDDIDNDIDLDPPESPLPIPEPEDEAPDTNRDFLTIRRRCELCKQRKVRCRTARQVFCDAQYENDLSLGTVEASE